MFLYVSSVNLHGIQPIQALELETRSRKKYSKSWEGSGDMA